MKNRNSAAPRELKDTNRIVRAAVAVLVAVIFLAELIIHFMPLKGATKARLYDYSKYPILEPSFANGDGYFYPENDGAVYRVVWNGGNLLQKTEVKLTFDLNGKPVLTEYTVDNSSLFFRQVGCSVNTVDGVIYIQVFGSRKTAFFTGGAEGFGFGIKINH